jgi:hypothetical protein
VLVLAASGARKRNASFVGRDLGHPPSNPLSRIDLVTLSTPTAIASLFL